MKRVALVGVLVLGAVAAAMGARTALDDGDGAMAPSSPVAGTPARSPTPASTVTPSARPPHPVSLQALMQKRFDGRAFRVGRVRARASSFTSYHITYKSGELTISGIMNVPRGTGPFPVIVLAHGYIDPEVYTSGRGFERTQQYLPPRGFAIVHVDYRNHASSDDDPRYELGLRLGYAEDVINAVLAVKAASLPYLDTERIGLLGRSMGGGVVLNALVVKPDLVDAAVLFAPVSSNAVDNFNRWIRRPQRRALAERIARAYGSPEEAPLFWQNVSARSFFDRIQVPIQIHHGTADESVPIAWSRRTFQMLDQRSKDVAMFEYPGEGHSFGPAFGTAMSRAVDFFERELR